jgi:hypothetical protein
MQKGHLPAREVAFYMGPFIMTPLFMDSWGQSVRQSGSNTYSPASQRRISFTQA